MSGRIAWICYNKKIPRFPLNARLSAMAGI